jgi:phenylpyruvate tautomerase PptA (4-oxalocrotonate tautomerase family)
MPIVDIEIVLRPGESLPGDVAAALADNLGRIFGSPQNGTWVKVRVIPDLYYAENGGKEAGVYPVFVSILKANVPDSEEMQREVGAITAAVAQICTRAPELIHIVYQPEGKGRVAFGGRIVT